MSHKITVQVGICSDEHNGTQKGLCVVGRLEGLDLDEFQGLVRRAIRSGIKSAQLFDKYGWELGELTESVEFMNDLEEGKTPSWEDAKAKYRLTSKSE